MRTWADRGRTLPGRHDPEWARLAMPPSDLSQYEAFGASAPLRANSSFTVGSGAFTVGGGAFSVTRGPRGDGR